MGWRAIISTVAAGFRRSSAPRRAGEGAAAVEAQEGGGRRVWTEAPRPAPIEWRFGGSFAEN
ncbi:MAG TPA: hypothetical protein VFO18_00235, partial [Methylomirabilota bacterium]|nr:hypothetical protein [Methylomirabilota bacterium]